MKKEKFCAISPTSRSPDIDAGWAWIIAVAALFASAISSGKLHPMQQFRRVQSSCDCSVNIITGVYFTFSMYFPILLNEFQASRAATAWVGSLNNGVYMLAGYHHRET